MEEFVIARNPDASSSLPYLLRIPLASGAVVLKAKDTWPRTNKIYCHPADAWPSPDDVVIVERVAVRSCVRRGVAVDLVLDRGRENRSQFVFTTARGREMVFWQSARTAKQARPSVRVPTARASGHELHVLVDTRERYAWKFADQQATTAKQAIPVGDYAVEAGGRVVAVVERKSVDDLVSTIVGGKFWMLLAELAAFAGGEGPSGGGSGEVPREESGRVAAIVVEDRYSAIFKLRHVRPTSIATQLAEAAVRYPAVPIVFAESRQLAQEWTFRFFGAAVDHVLHDRVGEARAAELVHAGSVPHRAPAPAEVRAWAVEQGLTVSDRGRIPIEVTRAYLAEHGSP
ncbi:MAG TPA: histone-like nucleoid-structuring protein Lsr2 [Ilumatobacteraceae bacterium]|nr:histone-like nucleoid-structuring protein Lsr2 [Ilumatobacteraceae bacterium]